MRFAHQRVSPLKKYNDDGQKAITNKNWNSRINSLNIYMHYNNAIFMGNMVSYKRNGQAVMLYDEGTSAVCDYSFDTMVGHNIFFVQDSIASLLILKKGSYEIAMRTGYFIFKIPFYESQNQPNGNGVLIDFKNNKVYHLIYQCGKLVRKILQTNKDILLNVSKQNLKSILDIRHQQAFKFDVKFKNGIKIERKQNKIFVGCYDNHNNLDGVCFKLYVDQNKYDIFSHPLQMKCIQRGFYHKGRLQNYGQRYFANGNLYIGQFSNDFFQGKGLLLYPTEQKWVFGQFEKEKLTKMIDTSVNQQSSILSIKANIKYLLKNIHQLNTNNWINTKIDNFMWTQIFNRFYQSIQIETTDLVIEKEKQKRQQEQRLRKIQVHFSNQNPNNEINRVIKTQKMKNRISPQKIKINQYTSKTAKILGVEPRSTENELYWSKEPSWKILPKEYIQRRHNELHIKQRMQYQGSLQKQRVSPLKSKNISNQLFSRTAKRRNMNDLYNSVQY